MRFVVGNAVSAHVPASGLRPDRMLKQRIITGLIFALSVIALVLLMPPGLVLGLFALIVVAASWEWAAFTGLTTTRQRVAYALVPTMLMGLLAPVLLGEGARDIIPPVMLFAAVFWAVAIISVFRYPAGTALWSARPVLMLIGLGVLLPPWVALALIRGLPNGAILVIYCIAAIAMADIGAYFAGRFFGGPKLMPAVSPAKTLSGMVGGVTLSLVFSLLFGWLSGVAPDRLMSWASLALAASLVSVFGDLLESMAKRHCGIKDSGSLLPGHGGLFDRVDSLSAGLPVFAIGFLLYGGVW